jgi:nucleotide-binding universal stress UspA family protein
VQAREGHFPEAILAEARRGYDLMLLGASGYTHPLGGAFIEEILKDPPVHVAIIKARDEKPRYHRILVPTAGDVSSQLAVEFAAMYAEDVGAEVTLLHVSLLPEKGRQWFRQQKTVLDNNTRRIMADTMLWELRPSQARAELRIMAKVVEGTQVDQEILRETRQGEYDLLILGASSRAGRLGVLLGERTEQVVSQAPCTVIVVMPRSLRASFPH